MTCLGVAFVQALEKSVVLLREGLACLEEVEAAADEYRQTGSSIPAATRPPWKP
jgi:hypothetical protein